MNFAKEYGKEKAYNDAIFKAFYQEEKNIGDLAVLAEIAQSIGFR